MSLQGMYKDGYFVSSVAKALCEAMPRGCRFVMMGSDGVANPDGSDPRRSLFERCIIFVLRWLGPPHVDNELAAKYLSDHRDKFDWSVVRPTDLVDGDVSEYDIFDHSHGSLFGSGVATRANVADMLVRLAVADDTVWKKYKHCMPVLYDKPKPNVEEPSTSSSAKDGAEKKFK
jgi:NAD(P)H-binding